MHDNNKLIIAAAGSGKTSFLIDEAIRNKEAKILITTYTIANSDEIRKKFIEKHGRVPLNVDIQTWFSFLIQHGVKPFQAHFNKDLSSCNVNGLLLTTTKSGVKYKTKSGIDVCYKEAEIKEHYFSKEGRVYSDKLSKFVVGGGDQYRETAERKQFVALVFERLERIYDQIYIDEVQDLAGYDLIFLKHLFTSSINIQLVCDPRQVTYLTHHEAKFNKYKDGKIKEYILSECKGSFKDENIDEKSLSVSHRNNEAICKLSSALYPDYTDSVSCECCECGQEHSGIFLVKKDQVHNYLATHDGIVQLRDKRTVPVNEGYKAVNFGESKGLTFGRVLIYPTSEMIKWLKNNNHKLAPTSRAKFYVAITRAVYSVGIICDEDIQVKGIEKAF